MTEKMMTGMQNINSNHLRKQGEGGGGLGQGQCQLQTLTSRDRFSHFKNQVFFCQRSGVFHQGIGLLTSSERYSGVKEQVLLHQWTGFLKPRERFSHMKGQDFSHQGTGFLTSRDGFSCLYVLCVICWERPHLFALVCGVLL